mmetsp:Transcript_2232/g.4079  ORF Transcript_2232/g.4079 Transcript_2232/m.4079 type:complete len:576 (+) Transcript_2232:38-1765(+)
MPSLRRSTRKRSASAARESISETRTRPTSQRKRKSSRRSNSATVSTKRRRSSRRKTPAVEEVEEEEEEVVEEKLPEEIPEEEPEDEAEDEDIDGDYPGEAAALAGSSKNGGVGQNLVAEFDGVAESESSGGLRRRRRSGPRVEEDVSGSRSGPPAAAPKAGKKRAVLVTVAKVLLIVILVGLLWFALEASQKKSDTRVNWDKIQSDISKSVEARTQALGKKFEEQYNTMKKDFEAIQENIKKSYQSKLQEDTKEISSNQMKIIRNKLKDNPKLKENVKSMVEETVDGRVADLVKKIESVEESNKKALSKFDEISKKSIEAQNVCKGKDGDVTQQIDGKLAELKLKIDQKYADYKKDLKKPSSSEETKAWIRAQIEGEIDELINRHLEKFSADRTGLVDYALRSAGGKVLASSPTRGGKVKTKNIFQYLRLPSKVLNQPPELALTPGISLGRCWAMDGGSGWILIKLLKPIVPTKISLEHASRDVVVDVESMPKSFEVYGTNSTAVAGGKEPPSEDTLVKLGSGAYDKDGLSLQQYDLTTDATKSVFKHIFFKLISNYGAPHTCLYRVRVHGNPPL